VTAFVDHEESRLEVLDSPRILKKAMCGDVLIGLEGKRPKPQEMKDAVALQFQQHMPVTKVLNVHKTARAINSLGSPLKGMMSDDIRSLC
jgi:hypothetical protein